MDMPADTRLTPEIAQEICERTGSAAALEGSIASLGTEYVLGLKAVNCRNGETLDEEQVQAARKEDVLNALTLIASKFRPLVSANRSAPYAGTTLAGAGHHFFPGTLFRITLRVFPLWTKVIFERRSVIRAVDRDRSEFCHGLLSPRHRVRTGR